MGLPFPLMRMLIGRRMSHLASKEMRKGFNHDTLYRWGEYDGKGEPISMNFESYYHKFVYTLDFAAAPWIGYNQSKSEGNTVNNASVPV